MAIENVFSVITVSYNQGKYIEETIKSVISQKGNFSLEYLIIDGASTDNTLEILERYKNLIDDRKIEVNCEGINFKYISEKDDGPTNALNKGLKMINGEVIGIINSDDIYPENALEKVWEEFNKNKEIEIVYGDVEFIDEEGNFIYLRKGIPNLTEKNFIYENPVIQPEVFIRKKVIEKVGIFDENFKFANDYEFWLRCIKNKIKFKYIPYTLAIFRKRKDARSASSNLFIFIETLKVQKKYFGKTKQLLKNIGIYSAMFAYGTNNLFETAFNILKKELLHNENFLTEQEINKAKSYGYLKFSIYKIFENRKEGIKSYIKSIKGNPFLFFTKNNFVFLSRLVLYKKGIYFKVKNFFKKCE
jgi:glycosyltransferase involved in cell wall biosynthesis